MNVDDLFPSKYVKGEELKGRDVTVTISHMTIEEMGWGEDKDELPVMWFEGKEKGLVLNKTNAMLIKGLYGGETADWRGKRITLYPQPMTVSGKRVVAIRVRPRVPAEVKTEADNANE